MQYEIIRTDTADEGIRKIILYVAQNFGNAVALEKLNMMMSGSKALFKNGSRTLAP